MPKALDKQKQDILVKYWEDGMTSTSHKKTIEKAAKDTLLTPTKVKQWIGNERKRRGQSRTRTSTRKVKPSVPCKTRKTSAYQMFKSDFFKSALGKSIEKKDGKSGLQRTANTMWKKLSAGEMEAYRQNAEEANQNPARIKKESCSKRVKRLTSLIHDSIDQLNDLGCPSLWIGLFGGVPERYFPDGVNILAEDEVFMNYTISSLVKSLAQKEMENKSAELSAEIAKSKTKKKTTKKKKETNNGTTAINAAPSSETNQTISKATASSNDVQHFQLLDARGKIVCQGLKVERSTVHGRQLSPDWYAFQVTDVMDSAATAWEDYPGEIEKGSYIAWPAANVRPVSPVVKASEKKKAKEAKALIDQLHPGFGHGSPSVLAKQPRKLREKKQS